MNVSISIICDSVLPRRLLGLLIAPYLCRLEFPSLKSKLMKGTRNGTA